MLAVALLFGPLGFEGSCSVRYVLQLWGKGRRNVDIYLGVLGGGVSWLLTKRLGYMQCAYTWLCCHHGEFLGIWVERNERRGSFATVKSCFNTGYN